MEFLVDAENKRLVGSLLSTRTRVPEPFVFGDEPEISVSILEESLSSVAPWSVVDLTGYSIRVGVGVPGAQPTAGTYTLTFGADTTSAIAFDADATAISSSINALASITAAGGVTVTALPLGFQIKFDSVGAQALITSTTDALYPSSSAYIYAATEGDGSTQEVQVFTLEQNNAAYTELTTDTPQVTTTVTTTREGVLDTTSEVQEITFDGPTGGGSYLISIGSAQTNPIPHDATSSVILAELQSLFTNGAGKIRIIKTGTTTISKLVVVFDNSLGNIPTMIVDTSNMGTGGGKVGNISFDTTEFLELLDGNQQTSAILEIVKYNTTTAKSETILQQPVLCRQDVVANLPASTTPLPTFASASHTHTESDITDLGTATTLNADTSLVGNAWFLDTDTLVEDDAEKVPSQQSVKAYVDAQISGLGSLMEFKGSYDATTDPTDGGIGDAYVVTVGGTGAASFWIDSLEVGDLIIQENDPATTEADWVVVSRDIIPATETTAGVVELATQAEVDTGTDTTRAITPDTLANYSGFPTGTPEGTAILSTGETVGKLLQADGDNSCSWVAAPSGTPEGTAILSTGETGGTKYLREDGDGTCSWQAVAGGDVVDDTTPQLGGDLDTNGNAIVTLSNADIELSPNGTGDVVSTTNSTIQRNGNFSTAGDAQAASYVLRCQTTSTTPVTMTLDGSSAEMTMSADTTWAFTGTVVARRGTTQDCAGYKIEGLVEYEDANGIVLLASTVTAIHEDDAAWNVTISATGTNLRLQAVGNTGENINWVASVQTVQTTNATEYY